MTAAPFKPVISDDGLPQWYTEEEIRHSDLPEVRYLIPDLLPVGLTILAAPPKVGKTFFAQQIEHYLSAQKPFLQYKPRTDSVRCLVIDLEGNAHITKKRSWGLQRQGDFSRIDYRHTPAGQYAAERLMWLDTVLTEAREQGDPYGYVRIDTLRLFLGPNPASRNAYDADNMNSRILNQICLAHGVAVLANTHLSKKSSDVDDWVERVTGSAGGPGGATGIWLLERTRGSSDGVLQTTSRDAEETEHPVRFVAGRWSFAGDITVEQARRTGVPRLILDYLAAHGPTRRSDLDQLANSETVGSALTRMRNDGDVDFRDSKWRLPEHQPHTMWTFGDEGQGDEQGGPATSTGQEEVAPPAATTLDQPADDPWPAEHPRGALARLKSAIGTVESRPCRPIPLIRKADRTQMPWFLAEVPSGQFSGGRHRWTRPDLDILFPQDARVVVLDRRASYPSAMSSVLVAPNQLIHTGASPMAGRAGVFKVTVAPFETHGAIGHPLGVDAERANGRPFHVTGPAIQLMTKLGIDYMIEDSWTGKPTSNLFEDWYKWVRDVRADLAEHPERLAEFKAETSRAIRLIWPKTRESGIWRPDWHQAIHAEANIRHWKKAYLPVMEAGDVLLSMANTDETVWLLPPHADDEWLPSGYVAGPGFGHVSVKARMTLAEWTATKDRRRGDG